MNGHVKQLRPTVDSVRLNYEKHRRDATIPHTSVRKEMIAGVLNLRHQEGYMSYYPQLLWSSSHKKYDVFAMGTQGSLAQHRARESMEASPVNKHAHASVVLKYVHGQPAVKRIAVDPNGGTWLSCTDLRGANAGFETWVMSTTKGIMTHLDALRAGVGGMRLIIVS